MVFPSGDRPVYGAQMQIEQASGIYEHVSHVGMSLGQELGATEPTSVILSTDGETQVFPIIEVKEDRCGVLEILASGGDTNSLKQVRIKDFSYQNCNPTVTPTPWIGVVETAGMGGLSLGELQISGMPEPMSSIQIEQHYY